MTDDLHILGQPSLTCQLVRADRAKVGPDLDGLTENGPVAATHADRASVFTVVRGHRLTADGGWHEAIRIVVLLGRIICIVWASEVTLFCDFWATRASFETRNEGAGHMRLKGFRVKGNIFPGRHNNLRLLSSPASPRKAPNYTQGAATQVRNAMQHHSNKTQHAHYFLKQLTNSPRMTMVRGLAAVPAKKMSSEKMLASCKGQSWREGAMTSVCVDGLF